MERSVNAILLCAGKGTRMNDERTHKVCYEIGGVPVIVRLIYSLKAAGVDHFTVVVGHRADKVMACVKDIEGVSFAVQEEQLGTADAVRCGLKELQKNSADAPVMVCMGDKLIDARPIRELIRSHAETASDVSFLAQDRSLNLSGGRVIERDGKFLAFLEAMDEMRLRLLFTPDRTDAGLEKAVSAFGLNEKKASKLLAIAKADRDAGLRALPAPLGGLTVADADAVTRVNTAFCLWESAACFSAYLSRVNTENAQGELYLTDAVTLAAQDGKRINVKEVPEGTHIRSYSTMDELKELERWFFSMHPARYLQLASERIRAFEDGDLDAKLLEIYGPHGDPALRRQPYLDALNAFIQTYGDREVLISRAPGRVNLMGRHIEHRGGSTNILAIDRETIAVSAPREDDTVTIRNTDPAFQPKSFSIQDAVSFYGSENWVGFIESEHVMERVAASRGDWSNYIMAGVLRLQLQNREKPLCGMDMLFSGNIPMAAGLSSSSSLVVATMEATIALNELDLQVQEFVALAGEGEWFVGSRGGAGDHAAMKCGKYGQITHMNFFPFSIGETVPWPKNYDIVVANSGIKAKKSDGARDKFNMCVACYELAFLWVLKEFPQYADRLKCMRDINQKTLGITEADIYRILLKVPQTIRTEEIYSLYPEEYHKRIRQVLATHNPFPAYPLRGVLLYGLAECARAEHCIYLLREGNYARLGELMCLSHNGDRIWQNGAPYSAREDDDYLYSLIDDLESGDAQLIESAHLHNQPGVYACSTKEIDMLIDYLISKDGVLGAQLSGAGLGGCIIALVEHSHTREIIDSLNKIYYKTRQLPPSANVFTPVAGSLVF